MATERELLESFAREARGRTEAIVEAMRSIEDGSSPALETLQSLRREAHTLKGTAAVLDLQRLSRLAALMEEALWSATDAHAIPQPSAAWLEHAALAFREGTEAAADAQGEPAAVDAAIASAPATDPDH